MRRNVMKWVLYNKMQYDSEKISVYSIKFGLRYYNVQMHQNKQWFTLSVGLNGLFSGLLSYSGPVISFGWESPIAFTSRWWMHLSLQETEGAYKNGSGGSASSSALLILNWGREEGQWKISGSFWKLDVTSKDSFLFLQTPREWSSASSSEVGRSIYNSLIVYCVKSFSFCRTLVGFQSGVVLADEFPLDEGELDYVVLQTRNLGVLFLAKMISFLFEWLFNYLVWRSAKSAFTVDLQASSFYC